jgi:hypothetical protein
MDKLIKSGAATYGQDYPPTDQSLDIEYLANGWAFRHKLATK